MTIQEIKSRTQLTAPYFFNKNTMSFFGQKLSDFKVEEQGFKYLISAPMKHRSGKIMGITQRLFNPQTNELEKVK